MRRHGHWGLTMILAVPFILLLPVSLSVPIFGMMLVTTLSPNKEHALSILGRRSITHTIWFAFFVAAIVMAVVTSFLSLVALGLSEIGGLTPAVLQPYRIGGVLAFGAFLGTLSHILGDTLVGGGSKPRPKPLWPIIRIPIQFGVTNQENSLANVALFRFMVVIVLLMYALRIGFGSLFFY